MTSSERRGPCPAGGGFSTRVSLGGTMRYPYWLPADLRAEVEQARTLAEIALRECRRRTPAPSERERHVFLVRNVIRPTVIAFAHQALQAVRGGHCRIDEIPDDIDKFRNALATELCPITHTWSGYADPFRREAREDLADSDEWLEHLKERAGLTVMDDGDVAARPAQSTDDASTPAAPALRNMFSRDGTWWRVVFEGKQARLKTNRGMQLLHILLANPTTDFTPSDLLARTTVAIDAPTVLVTGYGDADPVLDPEAIREYETEIVRIKNDMELAQNSGDKARENELREQQFQIVERLRKDTDGRGRPRSLGSESDRARKNASAALTRVRERIEKELPALARHLHDTIQTGNLISYQPNSDIDWTT